jgi:hypothetical protein
MSIDVIAVAVAFIAMVALVAVLMRGEPLFHAGRQSVYFLASAARACRRSGVSTATVSSSSVPESN